MLSKASTFAKLHASSQLNSLKSSVFTGASARFFAAPTQELLDNLKNLGIRNKNIVHNPT